MHLNSTEQLDIARASWEQASKLQMSLLRKANYLRSRQDHAATQVDYVLQGEEIELLQVQREAVRKLVDERWARFEALMQQQAA